jgi:uncharacterized RDD family membrane protein YckC
MVDEQEPREFTTENLSAPPIQIKPAPLARRIAAGLIDSIILALLVSISSLATGQNPGSSSALLTYSMFSMLALLTFIYYFLQEALFSATIGKYLVKLKVLDKSGNDCSFGASFKRNAVRFVDWLPVLYLVGAVAIIASDQRQRIGDRLAGTVVTARPEKDPSPPPAPFLFH